MKKHTHSAILLPTLNIKQATFWLGVCLIVLTGCGRAPAATPEPTAARASSVVISTFTPAPTDLGPAPESSATTAEPSPEAAGTGQIPGLVARNVTVTLEQNRFTCTLPVKGTVYYERSCTRGVPGVQVFSAVIYGTTPGGVDFIEAAVRQYENPDDATAIEILGLIAGLPYDGATPEEAKAWVESTVPALGDATQEAMFGGVKYVLSGPRTALKLEMGELP